MPAAAVAFWETLIGAVSLLALSAVIEGFQPAWIAALSEGRPLAGMAFLILGGSLVGFSTYLWLLREWGAFRAGLYAFVSPAIAVGAGIVLAGESFGAWEAVGMIFMLAATGLVVRPERASAS